MIQIGESLVSKDVFEKKFCCQLSRCKGACCVDGDSGAPLTDEEIGIIEQIFETIRPLISEKGLAAIDKQGKFVIDSDKDKVTPLVDNKECAYVYFENGIAGCIFEKAWGQGLISFRKPVSCHLYPVRIQKLAIYDAVNYDKWQICAPARQFGEENNIPVYKFLKDSLTRKYGEDWYAELELVASELEKRNYKLH
ncbi:MAG: DUF3109 family protein [Bacteroidales bacterium]